MLTVKTHNSLRFGNVEVGGDAAISVQSMTNTLTTDTNATIKQINELQEAGADIVKFQTFNADSLVTKNAVKAKYQQENTSREESQYEMIKKLELSKEAHLELVNYSKEKEIEFLSSAFDLESFEFLKKLNLKRVKIPSGEITNLPLLKSIGQSGKPIILSTGMSNIQEIERALNILIDSGSAKDLITVLHCNTDYPTPVEEVNLNAMLSIKEKFEISVGYSDHTLGFEVALAAVSLGASIIEKHFTLDKSLEGPDHSASLEPEEFKLLIKYIKNIELALGSFKKEPSLGESKNILTVRRSIVASKDIKKGEKFTENNLTTKRPGTGISPMKWDEVIGKSADRDYNFDDLIE